MTGRITAHDAQSINSDGKSGAVLESPVKSDADWFSQGVKGVLPRKAGLCLHLATGLGDERLCQKYAAGHVKPPAYFLRALLRGEDGWTWLCICMDGCKAKWWLEVKQAVAIKRAIEGAGNERRTHT